MEQTETETETRTPEWRARGFLQIARANDPADDVEIVARLTRALARADSQPALLAACEKVVAYHDAASTTSEVYEDSVAAARAAIAAARPEATNAD